MFIGRWQPFHSGHEWLIAQKRDAGVPVLVMIRDMVPDADNPYTAVEVEASIRARYDDVDTLIIPDVESVNYGRRVGYEVNEWVPPADVGAVSATKIRKTL